MNLEDRVRDELVSEAGRVVPPPGQMDAVIARGRRRRALTMTAVGAAMAVSVAAVGIAVASIRPGGEELGGVSSTAVATATTTTSMVTSTTAEPVVTTMAPAYYVGLAVASRDGIVVSRDGGEASGGDVGPIMLALSDGGGGYVFQIGTSASDILCLGGNDSGSLCSGDATQPASIISPAAGQRLQLFQVTEVAGHTSVVYMAETGTPGQDSFAQDLHVYDMVTGVDRNVAAVGDSDAYVVHVSYAMGTYLLTMESAEGLTWFDTVGADGSPVELSGNPQDHATADAVTTVWVGDGVIAPDGESMSFLHGLPRSEAPFQLVVVDLTSGDEISSTQISGVRDDNVSWLDWNGIVAVVSASGSPARVVLNGEVVDSPSVEGIATLLR